MEVRRFTDGNAVMVAEHLVAKRAETEKTRQIILDDEGNVTSCHDATLNPDPVRVAKLLQRLSDVVQKVGV